VIDKEKLLENIANAFSGVVYPDGHDFYRAIADREYQEYEYTNKKKKWNDIKKDELIRYYDFVFFLDELGVVYYLPAYMSLIMKYDKVANSEAPQSLFMELADMDVTILNENQRQTVKDFLIFCRDVLHPNIELDEELLEKAIKKLKVH
jgi:hypothetical protein